MGKSIPKLTRGYKNNTKLLKLLEQLYLYGAFSKEGISDLIEGEEKTSERYLLDLIYNFGENHIVHFFENNRKYYYAGFNYYRDLYNYLMKAYYFKTSTQGRIQGYFQILSALNAKPLQTAKELLDTLSEYGHDYNDSFIRDLANDMAEHGVLSVHPDGNRHKYAVTPDSLCDLTHQEVVDLYRALYYFSNTLYPFAVGDMARRNVAMYLENHRQIPCCSEDTIHVINKGFHLTLYEHSVVDLLMRFEENTSLEVLLTSGEKVLFLPERFDLDYSSTELKLTGTLVSGSKGYIHMYELLHGECPYFIENQRVVPSDVLLVLDVSFNSEEFVIHRLRMDYPKAEIVIRNDSLVLDVSAYAPDMQVEIILQELPLIQSLQCDVSLKNKIRTILMEGVMAHEDEQ